jgi:hypothetical protein
MTGIICMVLFGEVSNGIVKGETVSAKQFGEHPIAGSKPS